MPIELITTLRKKINIHFLIVASLAFIFLVIYFLFRQGNLIVLQVVKILTFFLVIHALSLYQRRKSLFKIFSVNPSDIIITFESYLAERKQHAERNKIIAIILIVLLTIGLFYELFNYKNTDWSRSLMTLWFAAILLNIADKWINMNTHIMLQDLKHSEQ